MLNDEQVKQVRLFKKYALGLVNAAISQLRRDRDIMEGGRECISGIAPGEEVITMDLYLVTMSMADKYYKDLRVIQENLDDVSKLEIDGGLMENIRLILVALDKPVEFFYTCPGDEVFSKYLSKYEKSRSHTLACSYSIKSAKSCYLTLRSINYGDNDKFFDRLLAGFGIASALMQDDGKDSYENATRKLQWERLNLIIRKLPKCGLTGYRSFDLKNEMKKLIESLGRDDEMDLNGK